MFVCRSVIALRTADTPSCASLGRCRVIRARLACPLRCNMQYGSDVACARDFRRHTRPISSYADLHVSCLPACLLDGLLAVRSVVYARHAQSAVPSLGSMVDLGAGTRANLDLPALFPALPDSVSRVKASSCAPIAFDTLLLLLTPAFIIDGVTFRPSGSSAIASTCHLR